MFVFFQSLRQSNLIFNDKLSAISLTFPIIRWSLKFSFLDQIHKIFVFPNKIFSLSNLTEMDMGIWTLSIRQGQENRVDSSILHRHSLFDLECSYKFGRSCNFFLIELRRNYCNRRRHQSDSDLYQYGFFKFCTHN